MSLSEEASIANTNISRALALFEHARSLNKQFHKSGDISLLELAIKHCTESVDLLPQDHPHYFLSCRKLAGCLRARSEISGDREDIKMSIHHGINSMLWCPIDHPQRMYPFNVLATTLLRRFQRFGDQRDLEFSLMYYKESLALHAVDHQEIEVVLVGLGHAFQARYRLFGRLEDLKDSTKYLLQAVSACPPDNGNRIYTLYNTSIGFRDLVLFHGDLADLASALTYATEALKLSPPGHFFRAYILTCLGECYSIRSSLTGNPVDLDLCLTHLSAAVLLRPVGHHTRSISLIDMAWCLCIRYQLYGNLPDIDTAVEYSKEALLVHPSGHPGRHMILFYLGLSLFTLFTGNGDEEELQTSIRCHEEALALRPPGSPLRSYSLSSLAVSLRARFEQHGSMVDLQSAITLLEEAFKLATPTHLDAASELAFTLLDRYHICHDADDLHLASDYLHKALERTPAGHPHLFFIYKVFAALYITMHSVDPSFSSQQQAVNYFEKAVSHAAGGLRSRQETSLEWINYAHAHDHPSELDAFKMSLTLLDQFFMVTPHVVSRYQIHRTKIPPTLASDAASCAISTGRLELAVELLEYGRALLWAQLTRMRTTLDALRDRSEEGKRLADEFASLSMQLEASNISPVAQLDDKRLELVKNYSALARQWEELVEEIRRIDGFSNFLVPASFTELQTAAAEGPIIILNVSLFRSDAIIVLKDVPPRLVPLQLTIKDVHQMSAEFSNVFSIYLGRGEERRRGSNTIPLLRKLWYRVVHPVVRELGDLVPRGSRIWWCPTSSLASLPLHAAGPYCKGQTNLPELYVSSHIPTLSSLIIARRKQVTPSSLLAIGQPIPYEGFGEGELQTVEEELNLIESICPSTMSFSRLYGPDAVFEAAIAGLKTHNWIHFACHGKQDTGNPYESCFAMGDKPLRLLDLMQARLDHSQFAFLSACHTAVGDVVTPDEVIHLAAGLQFSGLQSVVGTIGAVDDGRVIGVVAEFYKNIFDEGGRCTDAAQALNKTMSSLKRRGMPLDQRIIFVHIGA